MSKAFMSSMTACHIFLLVAIAMLQLEGVKSLNIGGFNINLGGPKVTLPEASKEFLSLQGVQVQSVSNGALVDCNELLKSKSKGSTLFVVNAKPSEILYQVGYNIALTHYGDFNSWEVAQQLKYNIRSLQSEGINVVAIGIGELPQAQEFLRALDLPKEINFYTDPDGVVQSALECSKGFAPNSAIPPWVRVFAMLTGIGSPGTISEAIVGYTGSNEYKRGRNWVISSLLEGSRKGRSPILEESAFQGPKSMTTDGLDTELKPFELATLRLQTGGFIVKNWAKLRPDKEELFTYQGGSFLFNNNGNLLYSFRDPGILNYAPIKEILNVIQKNNDREIFYFR